MKFVDEATIQIRAGKGGDGSAGFRREKFIPRGGPDGGDGGDGGSIYLLADAHINTLIDFRYKRLFEGENGQKGMGSQCTGKSGEDLFIRVPVGTLVFDADTDELIVDLTTEGQRQLVAEGGRHGLGNVHFKTSTNRAPRQFTKGALGEERNLRLELKLLADVGLLGLPNAGKSTFISSVSNARPKIADYPFTTLYPNLGVVRVHEFQSFVLADIPGLIEGASEGAGLGIQFLKHLGRTSLLLHLVDISREPADILQGMETILRELAKFDPALAEKTQWLVINKIDLVDEAELEEKKQAIVQHFDWKDPVFTISAVTHVGTDGLCKRIMAYLSER